MLQIYNGEYAWELLWWGDGLLLVHAVRGRTAGAVEWGGHSVIGFAMTRWWSENIIPSPPLFYMDAFTFWFSPNLWSKARRNNFEPGHTLFATHLKARFRRLRAREHIGNCFALFTKAMGNGLAQKKKTPKSRHDIVYGVVFRCALFSWPHFFRFLC